jgi:hypothetical protein
MHIGERVDFAWATEKPDAADVHVALFLEVRELEVAEHRDTIVVRVVVVPLISLGVDKENGVGEVIVVVDYVATDTCESDIGSTAWEGW